MKYTIDEIKKMQLLAGLINEVEYNESLWGVDKQSLTEAKEDKKAKEVKKEVTIDTVNPYEYRHGLAHELNELGEYTDEALEKAKATVLKNLAKDANFYSTLLNQKQSPYEFKKSETDAKGMQAKADGHLKKELKKDEKSNVKDNLGKKEEGSKKPKGVKVMPDKGVTGSEKTIKESIEEAKKKVINKYVTVEVEDDGDEYPMLNKKAVADYLKSVIDPSELKSVSNFMNDDEGFDESASYFFEDEYVDTTEKEVEDWAKQEMSYYLFSKPDEFPGKEMNEGSEKSDWTVGEEIIGGKKHYFLYNQETGKRKGMYKSKEEAEQNINEHHNDPNFPGGSKIYAMLDDIADEFGKDSDLYNDLEDAIVGWSDRNNELTPKGKIAIKALLSNWDLLDDYGHFLDENIEEEFRPGVDLGASFSKFKGMTDAEDQFEDLMRDYDWYYEMSDDPRVYDRGQEVDQKLKSLVKTVGTDRAVELYNQYAPSDRKITSTFFMEGKEDKHAKLKEVLKKKVKEALKLTTKEGKTEDEMAKKSAIQTEKAKLIALNKQKQELQADTTKAPTVKTTEKNAIDLKIKAATDSLNKLNQGKIDVV